MSEMRVLSLWPWYHERHRRYGFNRASKPMHGEQKSAGAQPCGLIP